MHYPKLDACSFAFVFVAFTANASPLAQIEQSCSPLSTEIRYNCWRDDAKQQPVTDRTRTEVRLARDKEYDRMIGVPFLLDAPDSEGKIRARGIAIDHTSSVEPFPVAKSSLVA